MDDLNSNFPLSNEERQIIAAAFSKRKEASTQSLQRARDRLKLQGKLTPESFKEIKLKYANEESNAEARLMDVLDELFTPSRLDELLLRTIARKEHEFGKVEFVQRKLKLEDFQVKIFADLPAFFLSQAFEQRKRIGTVKYDPALAAIAKARLDAARNSLTTDQFEVYGKAIGLIPKEVGLAEFLKTCSDDKRKELIAYKPCAAIFQDRK